MFGVLGQFKVKNLITNAILGGLLLIFIVFG